MEEELQRTMTRKDTPTKKKKKKMGGGGSWRSIESDIEDGRGTDHVVKHIHIKA